MAQLTGFSQILQRKSLRQQTRDGGHSAARTWSGECGGASSDLSPPLWSVQSALSPLVSGRGDLADVRAASMWRVPDPRQAAASGEAPNSANDTASRGRRRPDGIPLLCGSQQWSHLRAPARLAWLPLRRARPAVESVRASLDHVSPPSTALNRSGPKERLRQKCLLAAGPPLATCRRTETKRGAA